MKAPLPRDFWCLFQGQMVSQLGTQAFQVMALYWLARRTGTPGAGAAYLALGLLPPVLLGPRLARWAARFAPRRVLVGCDALSALLALPVVLALARGSGSLAVVALLLATVALLSSVNALLLPSLTAAVPLVVPRDRLAQANAWMFTTQQLAAVLGQGLGGALYALAGPAGLSAVTALGFALSAGWSARLRSASVRVPPAAAAAMPRSLALLRRHPGLGRLTAVSALFNVLYAPWLVLLPFHLAPGGAPTPLVFGAVLACYGAGNLLGALLLRRLRLRAGARLLGAALLAQAAGLVLLGGVHGAAAIGAVLAALGVGIGLVNVQVVTRLQTCVPPQQVAPATAVMRASVHLATPLGFGAATLATSVLGLAPGRVYQACGLALALALWPQLGALRREEALEAEAEPLPAGIPLAALAADPTPEP